MWVCSILAYCKHSKTGGRNEATSPSFPAKREPGNKVSKRLNLVAPMKVARGEYIHIILVETSNLYLKFCMSGVKLFERNLANHRPSSRLTLVGKILVRFVLRIFPDIRA